MISESDETQSNETGSTQVAMESSSTSFYSRPKMLLQKSAACSQEIGTVDEEEDDDDAVDDDAEIHYNIKTAKSFMAANVRRNGDARYAIKRLHADLNNMEQAWGMNDLAMETKFLSSLDHPNIIKMRGHSSGPMINTKFFIILD
jgi:hypothetical protein